MSELGPFACRTCGAPLRYAYNGLVCALGIVPAADNAPAGMRPGVDCDGRKRIVGKVVARNLHKLECRSGHRVKVPSTAPTPACCEVLVPARQPAMVGGYRPLLSDEPGMEPCGLPLLSKGWVSR